MVCKNCHATIADKAIVCYRCGAPTAEPAPAPPVRRASYAGIVWAIVLAAAALVLWWQLPGPMTAAPRVAAAITAVLAILIALLRLLRRRGR